MYKYWPEQSKGLFLLRASGTRVLEILWSHSILGDGVYFETDSPACSDKWHLLTRLKFWVSSTQWETDPLKFGTKLTVGSKCVERQSAEHALYMCSCGWKWNTLPEARVKNIVAIGGCNCLRVWVLASFTPSPTCRHLKCKRELWTVEFVWIPRAAIPAHPWSSVWRTFVCLWSPRKV